MTAVPWRSTHLDRSPATLLEIATESLGIYSSPPVSHLEFAARCPGYSAADLDDAFARREVVGLRTLRGSAFLIPVDLLPVVVAATRDRNVRAFGTYVDKVLHTADYATWSDRIEDVMSDGVHRTVAEIKDALDPPDEDRSGLSTAIHLMATECRLVGTGTAVSWRSGERKMARWTDWLPGVDVDVTDIGEARSELARRYLDAWGPATVEDFAWWSGLTKSQAAAAFDQAAAKADDGYFWTRAASGDPPGGVRLLPWWDTLFVTWKDRSRFLPDHLYEHVYDSSGNAAPVVLLDGRVAGVWSLGPQQEVLEIAAAPFDAFSDADWSMIEEEARVLARLAGSESALVSRHSHPPHLPSGKRNLFMRPLG